MVDVPTRSNWDIDVLKLMMNVTWLPSYVKEAIPQRYNIENALPLNLRIHCCPLAFMKLPIPAHIV